MSDGSKISWLARPETKPATWNPIRAKREDNPKSIGVHCEHASEGCRHCYAERWNNRFGTAFPFTRPSRDNVKIYLDYHILRQPLHWRARRTIFVGSTNDLFGEWVPDNYIDKIFAIAALCPQHTFIFLTKRAERMREYFDTKTDNREDLIGEEALYISGGSHYGIIELPLPNVWLGMTSENQVAADERVPLLLQTPAAIRFVSCEPMLAPVDLQAIRDPKNFPGCLRIDALLGREYHEDDSDLWTAGRHLDWVICGGESGPHARPMHPDWARSLRDQCAAAGVPFFFKQWGEWACVYDRDRDDPDWRRCADIKQDTPNGQWLNIACGQGFHGERVVRINCVGRATAGDTLDSAQHHEWPEVR